MVATVFVGNVAYDATEAQLRDIFSEVGTISAFRLVYDKESGKAKGYGFCEYKDKETALSAMRNLNGREVNGRNLRVDFAGDQKEGGAPQAAAPGKNPVPFAPDSGLHAEEEKAKEALRQKAAAALANVQNRQPIGMKAAAEAAAATTSFLGFGGAGISGDDGVSTALGQMSRTQIYELMSQMKGLVSQNKQQAREILVGNPALCRALFQAQIMLGMVGNASNNAAVVLAEAIAADTAEAAETGQPGGGGMAGGIPPPMTAMPPGQQQPYGGIPVPPPAPSHFPPPPSQHMPYPSAPHMQMPRPPMPVGGPPQQQQGSMGMQQQQALIQQVMSMTPAQIAALPPAQQQQIFQIQAQVRAQGGR